MKWKRSSGKQLAIVLLGVLCLSALLHADMRHFTDKEGRTIKAEFVSVRGDFVTLKREDGKEFTVRVDTFARVDVDYIRECAIKAGMAVSGALAPLPVDALLIEAQIDGPSELRVKKDGIYWINGPNAKPGRHERQNFPTYLNGREWRPVWQEPEKDRGRDTSSTEAVPGLDPKTLNFTLLSVGQTREAAGIEERDKIEVTSKEGELAIRIPDSQGGSRWYKFELSSRKKQDR